MNRTLRKDSPSRIKTLASLGSFLTSGWVLGLVFGWLVTRPSLKDFFFNKGDKFPVPHYSYWFAFSFLQVLGLVAAYLICVSRHWFRSSIPKHRLLCVFMIVGLAAPALRLITPVMNSRIGLDWDIAGAPIAFVFLLSVSLCILSGELKLLPLTVIWNSFFIGLFLMFGYAVQRITEGGSDWTGVFAWPMLESALALSFVSWLVWRQRANANGATQQTLGADSPVSDLYS